MDHLADQYYMLTELYLEFKAMAWKILAWLQNDQNVNSTHFTDQEKLTLKQLVHHEERFVVKV